MGANATNPKEAAWAKAKVEVEALEAAGAVMVGSAFPEVLFVKGTPNEREAAGEALLSGADGEALSKALTALGYPPEGWACILGRTADGEPATPELLRRAVAVLAPFTLVALDDVARRLACEAFADDLTALADLSEALLEPGFVAHAAGLRIVSLGGFERALASPERKQLMWARLKRVPPLSEPY